MNKMKSIYITFIALLAFGTILSSCNKEDIESKKGVSLPPVQNLSIQIKADGKAALTWQMPSGISPEIAQPLNVLIEIKEVFGLKTNSLGTITLPNAPTSYEAAVPDRTKKYQITVKLNGRTTINDRNYSGNIVSLGQTVQYN